ncbi:MAG TPA: BON domain-containing protein [Steroidobacteraceae bacterium]|jgi:osmotically-inducible protein OsmY|nr:BON domain-containing protein [Steroidobacteraceae bacterium]
MSGVKGRVLSAAAAAVIVVCATACASAPEPKAERLADRATANRVENALNADQYLYARHINVRADGGMVTLSGYAWTPEELTAAQQDAQRVSGVTQVVNRIEVDRGGVGNGVSGR